MSKPRLGNSKDVKTEIHQNYEILKMLRPTFIENENYCGYQDRWAKDFKTESLSRDSLILKFLEIDQ